MPFCSNCGSSYELGIDKCPKCNKKVPRLKSFKKLNKLSKSAIEASKEKKEFATIPVAGIGKRIASGTVDLLISIGILIFIGYQLLARRFFIRGWLSLIIISLLAGGYILLRDSLKGKSFGKLLFGLSVINLERRKTADFPDSILRNSMLGILAIPFIGWAIFALLTAIIIIQISLGKEQRIGDRFAHTKVIEDKFLDNIYIQE